MSDAARPRILIVEDDMLFQSVYETRLAQEGYDVRVASNGNEALAMIRESPPDLVLLDLMLPGMSGFDLLERVKKDPATANVSVIILSNRGDPEEVNRGLGLGAIDYLLKTVARPQEVTWKIKQALAAGTSEVPSFRVAIRPARLDADDLARNYHLDPSYRCRACDSELALQLTPTLERDPRFQAQFVCPKCRK
jgi:DNA-binding response OmpR family regulator